MAKDEEIASLQTKLDSLDLGEEEPADRKTTTKSDNDVIGNFMDSFTSVNTSRYINTKMTEINQRIYEESILNRK